MFGTCHQVASPVWWEQRTSLRIRWLDVPGLTTWCSTVAGNGSGLLAVETSCCLGLWMNKWWCCVATDTETMVRRLTGPAWQDVAASTVGAGWSLIVEWNLCGECLCVRLLHEVGDRILVMCVFRAGGYWAAAPAFGWNFFISFLFLCLLRYMETW